MAVATSSKEKRNLVPDLIIRASSKKRLAAYLNLKDALEQAAIRKADSTRPPIHESEERADFTDHAALSRIKEDSVMIANIASKDYNAIVGALERFNSRTYGICSGCVRQHGLNINKLDTKALLKVEIPLERLESLPTARLCARHQEMVERAAGR